MNTATAATDAEQNAKIDATLATLFPELRDGEYVELRVFRGRGGARCGYYRDLNKLSAVAVIADSDGCDCYVGLNPRRKPDIKIDANTWVAADDPDCPDCSIGAGDDRVTRRQWLLIDVDPERKGTVCSTAAEKSKALDVLKAVLAWLCQTHGWPQPAVIGDSGNGWHALWAVNETADEATKELFREVLTAVAAHCGTPDAKIDTSVFNAERISRLYGTTNRKGENTSDRPHRQSGIKATTQARAVTHDELAKVATLTPQTAKPKPAAAKPVSGTTATATASSPQVAAARAWADQQPAAVAGEGGHKQTFAVACGLVRDWGLSVQQARPILAEYSLRCDPPWDDNELEHKLDDAEKKAAEEQDRVGWRWKKELGDDEDEKASQYDKLVALARNNAELWADERGRAFATVERKAHAEHYCVEDERFADWLVQQYHDAYDSVPKTTPLSEAVAASARWARLAPTRHQTNVRVAYDDVAIWHDLCDEQWRAVRITANGWAVETKPGVRFVRTDLLAPLPEPERGGSWDELRPLVNVDDDGWVLLLAFLVGCLMPRRTFPLLLPHGPQGSGKGVLTAQITKLVDPLHVAPQAGVPESDEDLILRAEHCYLQSFNNVSSLSNRQSDNLCCLVEGASTARRTKYKDSTLSVFAARRPVIANGISLVAERGDLLSRSLALELSPPATSRTEDELWREFEKVRPRILGCLYDAVACALRNLPNVRFDNPPRLHDFALWAVAAEPALGVPPGSVEAALRANRADNSTAASEASPIPALLRAILNTKGSVWTASASDWLAELEAWPGNHRSWRGWPKAANALGSQLLRLQPDLRAVGIVADRDRAPGGNRAKFWTLRLETEGGVE